MKPSLASLLREIVAQHGRSICEHPDRVRALLADLLGADHGAHKQQVNILILALENHIVRDMLDTKGLPLDMVSRRAVERLKSDFSINDQAAQAVVGTWGVALGLWSSPPAVSPPAQRPASPAPPVPRKLAPTALQAPAPNIPVLHPAPTRIESMPAHGVPGPAPASGRRWLVAVLLIGFAVLGAVGAVAALKIADSTPASSASTSPDSKRGMDVTPTQPKTEPKPPDNIRPTTPAIPDTKREPPPPTEPKAPPASIRIVPVTSVSLQSGQTRTVSVQVERQNCKGPVELRLEGLPAEVQAKPAFIPADRNSAVVELTAGSAHADSSHSVRVTAVAADARAEAQFQLMVQKALPSFAGSWRGQYFYPENVRDPPVTFDMEVVQNGTGFTASCKEPNTFKSNPKVDKTAPYLHAGCSGSFDERTRTMNWTKTYDGKAGADHSVTYSGVLSADEKRIDGTWTLRLAQPGVPDLTGRFTIRKLSRGP